MIIFIFQFGFVHTIDVYIYNIQRKKQSESLRMYNDTNPAEAATQNTYIFIISFFFVQKHFFRFIPCNIIYSIKKIPES